jgi:hypothetical protein
VGFANLAIAGDATATSLDSMYIEPVIASKRVVMHPLPYEPVAK